MRVLLVTADAAIRARWRRALRRTCVIHQASERDAVLSAMVTLKPDVLLLDVSLPKLRRGADLATIQRANPATAVLLLTRVPTEREAITTLKRAVRGYGSVWLPPSLLRTAVEKIHLGEVWAGRRVLSRLVGELALTTGRHRSPATTPTTFSCLTPREREIASMVTEGAVNKEIAGRLNIKEGTVKARLAAVFRKLGCANRVQLALLLGSSRPSRP